MTRSRKGKGTTEIEVGDLVYYMRKDIVGRVIHALPQSGAVYVEWKDKSRNSQWSHAAHLTKISPEKQPPKSSADPEITSYYEAITEGS